MDHTENIIYKIANYFENRKNKDFMKNWSFQQILSTCLASAREGCLLRVCKDGKVVAAMIGKPSERPETYHVVTWACDSTECFREILKLFFAQERFRYVSGIHKNKDRIYNAKRLSRMQSLLLHCNKHC